MRRRRSIPMIMARSRCMPIMVTLIRGIRTHIRPTVIRITPIILCLPLSRFWVSTSPGITDFPGRGPVRWVAFRDQVLAVGLPLVFQGIRAVLDPWAVFTGSHFRSAVPLAAVSTRPVVLAGGQFPCRAVAVVGLAQVVLPVAGQWAAGTAEEFTASSRVKSSESRSRRGFGIAALRGSKILKR